jgi:arylsulfatase
LRVHLTGREEHSSPPDVGAKNSWVAAPVVKIVGELEASLRKYPPIKVGTPEPVCSTEIGSLYAATGQAEKAT